MSCLGGGLGDWMCAEDETINLLRVESQSKGPMAALLSALDYYPLGPEDEDSMMPIDSQFESDSEARSIIDDDERTGPAEGEHLHKEELALEVEPPEESNPIRSPECIPYTDHKLKAQMRAKELEELRQRKLTSHAANLDTADAPTDVDTFHRRQKELNEARRKNQMLAKDFLHAYRADDKQVLDEIRRKLSKGSDARWSIQASLSAPAYFTMAEIDEFHRQQKDIVTWRTERVKSFGDGVTIPESETAETIVLSDEFRVKVNIKKIQTILDGRESIEAALRSPLPDSPPCGNSPVALHGIPSGADRSVLEPEGAIFGEVEKKYLECSNGAEELQQKSAETDENSDIESTESTDRNNSRVIQPDLVKGTVTMENMEQDTASAMVDPELLGEDSIRSQSQSDPWSRGRHDTDDARDDMCIPCAENHSVSTTQGKTDTPAGSSASITKSFSSYTSLIVPPKIKTPGSLLAASRKSQVSTLKAGALLKDTRKSLFSDQDSASSPDSTLERSSSKRHMFLKRVPLYARRPTVKRQKGVGTICSNKYIPNLHPKRDGCERCLYWASSEEKEKFKERGHHLRIMMVRGGCGRDCTVFPRNGDEFPVRLCKKCYFDTHRDGSSSGRKEEEDKLLWSNGSFG